MVRKLACVGLLAASAAIGLCANASTTQLSIRIAGTQSDRANHRGLPRSQAGRAGACSARPLLCFGDLSPSARPTPQMHPSMAQVAGQRDADDPPDLRGEYKGLLTDAILRLIKDLKPLLAAR